MRTYFCNLGIVLIIIMAKAHATEASPYIEQYRGPQAMWPKPTVDANSHYAPLAPLPKTPPYPKTNPYSEAKRALGEQLFFDRRLSLSQQIACASCHDPDLGWADGRRQAIGHNRQQHQLNSPTVVNSAWLKSVFWDGRVQSLEAQIMQSWQNPIEMAATPTDAARRIKDIKGYSPLFSQAFGSDEVTVVKMARAIATFTRSLTLTNTRFDQFMRGEREIFSDKEIRGLHLFRTKGRCINCHNGALLSDGQFHHLGSSFHNVGNFEGRYSVTGNPTDVGAFRTPGLRGIGATAPYLHNGYIKDLDTLLVLYNIGWWQNAELKEKGNDIPTATLSPHIKPLHLSEKEVSDLHAFLNTLNGTIPWLAIPKELH